MGCCAKTGSSGSRGSVVLPLRNQGGLAISNRQTGDFFPELSAVADSFARSSPPVVVSYKSPESRLHRRRGIVQLDEQRPLRPISLVKTAVLRIAGVGGAVSWFFPVCPGCRLPLDRLFRLFVSCVRRSWKARVSVINRSGRLQPQTRGACPPRRFPAVADRGSAGYRQNADRSQTAS